jgi:hypothetical protein
VDVDTGLVDIVVVVVAVDVVVRRLELLVGVE